MEGELKVATPKRAAAPAAGRKVFCRVCPKWEIKRPEKCSNTVKRGAETLYFCTSRCKERYVKVPEKFA